MTWQFARVHLQETNYSSDQLDWSRLDPPPVHELNRIYQTYCAYKKFTSVMPMITGRYLEPHSEVIGYHARGELVAWSLLRCWDQHNVLSDNWAWNYAQPSLRLGIRSIQTECAIYRDRGFHFMYFERAEPYMLQLQAFEILGAL